MCCLLHFLYETFFKCVSFTIDYRLEFNDRQHCHSNIVFLNCLYLLPLLFRPSVLTVLTQNLEAVF